MVYLKGINSFDPDQAIGSSIDVLSRTGIDKVYTPHIIQEILSAGYGPITYRNNTELRMAAWHWTENGMWSDPAHRSGYFTGRTVRVVLEDSKSKRKGSFSGPVSFVTFGIEQYMWKNDGPNSHADPDGPPVGKILPGGPQAMYTLPKASVTVLRGKAQGL